jgi:hypothetical protein
MRPEDFAVIGLGVISIVLCIVAIANDVRAERRKRDAERLGIGGRGVRR